mgnify:CR=1 FL=1
MLLWEDQRTYQDFQALYERRVAKSYSYEGPFGEHKGEAVGFRITKYR